MDSVLTPIEQHLVDFITKLRKNHNQTQEDIAFILGVDKSFIARIENSKHRAKYSLNHVVKLSDHFGISIRSFFPDRIES